MITRKSSISDPTGMPEEPDIIGIDRKWNKWVIQCKHYNGKIGNSTVQEVVATKTHYHAKKAAVMTNSELTKNARDLAKENAVVVYEKLGP